MKTSNFKSILVIICFSLSTLSSNGQSKSQKMYDAFANKDGISSFTFSKNMIDAIDFNSKNDGKEKNVTGDLHQVRFMSYNPEKGSLAGAEFMDKAIGYLPKMLYNKFEDEDADNDTEIWLLGEKKKYTECHVFIKNETANELQFVVSFYGDFTVKDIDKLKKTGKDLSND